MKLVLGLIGLLLAIVIIGTYLQASFSGSGFSFFNTSNTTLTIDNHTFNVTVAKSSKDQQIGLSNKNNINNNQGELFVFNTPDKYQFWMRDMKFPIDIIYMNQGKIVQIFKNIPAPQSKNDYLPIYTPNQPADKVLEINAGLSDKDGFKIGDSVSIKNL